MYSHSRIKNSFRGVLAAKQSRSEQTIRSLLDSAREVLSARGAAGATVSEIAEHAGLSVGVVYRRFKDKDALIAATFEDFYAQAQERRRKRFEAAARLRSFHEAARFVIGDLLARTKEHAALLRCYWIAMLPDDIRARQRIDRANSEGFEQIAQFLLQFTNPKRHFQVRFGLQCVAHAIRGTALYETAQPLQLHVPDEDFVEELSAMLTRYAHA